MKTLMFAFVLLAVSKAMACDAVAVATAAAKSVAAEQGAVAVSISPRYDTDKIFGEPAAIVRYTFVTGGGQVAIGSAIVDLTMCSVDRTSVELANTISAK
jgi:hypothetical protein